MQIIFSERKELLDTSQGLGVALGNFDGLHIGHMKLIKDALFLCKQHHLKSMVYSFDEHPENVIAGKLVTPLITTSKMKARLLENFNLDYLYLQKFDANFMKITAEEFIEKILVKQFNARAVTIGFDHRFGYKGMGNAKLLQEMGSIYGFQVNVVEPIHMDGKVISSSIIRKLILEGNMELASKYLGRNYVMEGRVVQGKRVGNKLGFPTANLVCDSNLITPAKGVYITKTTINNTLYNSVTNVGTNPTFHEKGVHIETHILDFNENLYGQEISVHFLKKIRDEKKFSESNQLLEQIKKDVQYAYKFFNNNKYLQGNKSMIEYSS